MNSNEERLLVLSRLGRETIIKNGTYDIERAREIDPDNPEKGRTTSLSTLRKYEQTAQKEPAPAPISEPTTEEEASDLAAEILASNFKTGMTQEEVDAFLKQIM